MVKPSKIQVIIWILLLIISVVFFSLNYCTYQLGTYLDDANYTILSRSLIFSDRYGLINNPGEPLQAKFPVGFPLLLSPFVLLFSDNLEGLKILSLLATLLTAILFFWGWRWLSKSSYWWSLGIIALFLLSPVTVDFSRQVMSDAIFATFCTASLVLVGYVTDKKPGLWWIISLGIVLAFTVLIRTIGVIVPIFIFTFLLIKNGFGVWKDLVKVLAVMLLMIYLVVIATPYQMTDLVPESYLREQNATLRWISGSTTSGPQPTEEVVTTNASPSFIENTSEYLRWSFEVKVLNSVRRAVFPIGGGLREQELANRLRVPFLPAALKYAFFVILLLGYFRWFRREGFTAFSSFGIFYYLVIFFWSWEDIRFLYPIYPQILFAFILGLGYILSWIFIPVSKTLQRPRIVEISFVGLLVVLALFSAYKSIRLEDSRVHAGDITDRTAWVKEETPVPAIIMTEAPQVDYLYGLRKTVSYPEEILEENLSDYLVDNKIEYVLLAPRIFWQDQYIPTYSEQTDRIMGIMQDWTQDGKASLVYTSGPSLITVYKINIEMDGS
jgi:4-amino-4-deoxy-L-arabinose transferase-like glycosyltransferase